MKWVTNERTRPVLIRLYPLLGWIGASLCWWLIAELGIVRNIPPPENVLVVMLGRLGEARAWIELGSTLQRTFLAFMVSAIGGIGIGAAMGALPALRAAATGFVDFLRSIPAPALLPVFIAALGLYDAPKIAFAVFVCLLINLVYTGYGVANEAASERAQWCRTITTSNVFLLRSVLLPGAVPYIIAGLRVTMSLSLVLVTLGEYILMTGQGIGVAIRIAYEDRQFEHMFATILILGIAGYIINVSFLVLERSVFRWFSPGRGRGVGLNQQGVL
jgi:ABC-type nitrate/sulfonate/bicarbonate transport system permease component